MSIRYSQSVGGLQLTFNFWLILTLPLGSGTGTETPDITLSRMSQTFKLFPPGAYTRNDSLPEGRPQLDQFRLYRPNVVRSHPQQLPLHR